MKASRNARIRQWFGKSILFPLLLIATRTLALDTVVLVQPHGETRIYDLTSPIDTFQKEGLSEQFISGGITFNITYKDVEVGFTDPASGEALRTRFKDVLAYVAEVINYDDRTLDIQVEASEFDGTGALASAGTFFPVLPGIHPGSTLQRLNSGFKPFSEFPEISVTVDLGFTWNLTANVPTIEEADFFSVLLHEITHGLGFSSLIDANGTSGIGKGIFTVYDSLLIAGTEGQALLSNRTSPVFQADISSLTSADVWFDGSQAIVRYDQNAAVPVYAPGPFEPGSSLSHWDLNALEGASVMTHTITLGTMQREYASVDLGALIDLGYNRLSGAPAIAPTGCATPATKGATTRVAGGDLILLASTGLGLLALRRY